MTRAGGTANRSVMQRWREAHRRRSLRTITLEEVYLELETHRKLRLDVHEKRLLQFKDVTDDQRRRMEVVSKGPLVTDTVPRAWSGELNRLDRAILGGNDAFWYDALTQTQHDTRTMAREWIRLRDHHFDEAVEQMTEWRNVHKRMYGVSRNIQERSAIGEAVLGKTPEKTAQTSSCWDWVWSVVELVVDVVDAFV